MSDNTTTTLHLREARDAAIACVESIQVAYNEAHDVARNWYKHRPKNHKELAAQKVKVWTKHADGRIDEHEEEVGEATVEGVASASVRREIQAIIARERLVVERWRAAVTSPGVAKTLAEIEADSPDWGIAAARTHTELVGVALGRLLDRIEAAMMEPAEEIPGRVRACGFAWRAEVALAAIGNEYVRAKSASSVEGGGGDDDRPEAARYTPTGQNDSLPKLTPEQRALAVLAKHPEWPNTKIAKKAEVHAVSLSRWKTFRGARAALKASRFDRPSGHRDARSGKVEAVASSECRHCEEPIAPWVCRECDTRITDACRECHGETNHGA